MMRNYSLVFLFLAIFNYANAQVDKSKIKKDLDEILTDISSYYVYLEDKNVDLNCLKNYYSNQIEKIKTEEETVLFFEYLLDEFYDSHLILNTNRNASFRLFAPIYASLKNGKMIISNVWQSQIKNIDQAILGAEILKFNGIDFEESIDNFPIHCNDKNSKKVREWIGNKVLAGRYNEPRILTLKLTTGTIIDFDLDKIILRKDDELLTAKRLGNIGIIRVNNSLGNNELIEKFDHALDNFFDTRGLIIDLRNTVDGGNSYVARGIMSRFVDKNAPYQIHVAKEKHDHHPMVERRWTEYVSPRGKTYKNKVIVLVGRWTGSMGEGLAIGFEGIKRGEVVGTAMERLAGAMSGFSFKHQSFGFRLSTEKLYHVNGTPREQYLPTHYVRPSTLEKDEILEKGIELIKE